MEIVCEPDKQTLIPPNRGFALGWRLALSTTLIISLVMGVISFSQQLVEIEKDREIQQELLRISLFPLAVRLESVDTFDAMQEAVEEFHMSYVKKGHPLHEVELLNTSGKPLLTIKIPASAQQSEDTFQAETPIVSPLLEDGRATLTVRKHVPEYGDALQRSWLLWSAHFAVTVSVVFLFLTAAIYFQVTRPINRLVQGVKKMEMGYWGPIDIGSGAWEVRWLAWRFGNMVQEVRTSMTHLVEAERKAWTLMPEVADISESANKQLPHIEQDASDRSDSPVYRKLISACRRLETASPDDPQAIELAQGIWRNEALEANRFGFHQLKARLEDAALRLMKPDTFISLDKRLSELKVSWRAWATEQRNTLLRTLEDKGIPCAGVLHRVKHTAGVWTKMNGKGLDFDEVYDLFAFRIIVPTEADCYAALGVVHQVYQPEVSRFKDYIANPKGNNYRSLHTCVKADDGPVFEVQIRSVAMDRQAERGDVAHWLYKKSGHEASSESATIDWWSGIQQWFTTVILLQPRVQDSRK